MSLSLEQARAYQEKFFGAYPGLGRWHHLVGSSPPHETRTLFGRRRVFAQPRFTEQLNSPVQGSGADAIKAALALLWERRAEHPNAFPVLVVHDELVVEADEATADRAANWVKAAMIDAFGIVLDPVPVEVDVKIGRTWGGE